MTTSLRALARDVEVVLRGDSDCASLLPRFRDCQEFSSFVRDPLQELYGKRHPPQQETSRRRFGVGLARGTHRFEEAGDPYLLESLSILLNMDRTVLQKHYANRTSLLERIHLGLTADDSDLSFTVSSLFREHDRYFELTQCVMNQASSHSSVRAYADSILSESFILHLLEVFRHDVECLQSIQKNAKSEYLVVANHLSRELTNLLSVLHSVWSFVDISFPHLLHFLSSLNLLASLAFPSVCSLAQLTLVHALVASASLVSANALPVLSLLSSDASPATTALAIAFQPHVTPSSYSAPPLAPAAALVALTRCLAHVTPSAQMREVLRELFDSWFLALSEDTRRSVEAIRFLGAAMTAGLEAEPLLTELELLAHAIAVDSPLFDDFCALLASGRTEDDRRHIATFILGAPETAVSPLDLFKRLAEKPTKSLIALFGTIAEGVAKGSLATSLALQDVLEVLSALALRTPSLAAAAFASMRRGVVRARDGEDVVKVLVGCKMLERSFIESLEGEDAQVAFAKLLVQVAAVVGVSDASDVAMNTKNATDVIMNAENATANKQNTATTIVSFAATLLPLTGLETTTEIRLVQFVNGLLSHDDTAKPLQDLLKQNVMLCTYLVSGLTRSKALAPSYLQLLTLLSPLAFDATARRELAEAVASKATLRSNLPSLVAQSLDILHTLCDEASCCPPLLNEVLSDFPVAVQLAEEDSEESRHRLWMTLLQRMGDLMQSAAVQSILTDATKTMLSDTLRKTLPSTIETRNTELLACLLPLPTCDFVAVDRSTLLVHLAPLVPQLCQSCEKPNEQRCLLALLHIAMKSPQTENVIPDFARTLQHAYASDTLPLVALLPAYLATLRPFPEDLLPSLATLLQKRNVAHLEPLLESLLESLPKNALNGSLKSSQTLSPATCRLLLPPLAALLPALTPSARQVAYALLLKGSELPPLDVSLLLQDAVGEETAPALSALALLKRLLSEAASFETTLTTMMAMESECTRIAMWLETCDADLLANHPQSSERVERVVATLDIVACCAKSPRFVASVYCGRFQHVLSCHRRLLCLYVPALDNSSSSLPPPMAPELLSPIETKRMIRILRALMRIADAPPKDATSLDLRVSILQSICTYSRILFDPFPPYTVDASIREECQSAMKRLVESLPLDEYFDAEYASYLRKECSCCRVCFSGDAGDGP